MFFSSSSFPRFWRPTLYQQDWNNMGGSPEWHSRMMYTLKNFNLDSPVTKQKFDRIGLTYEEVIIKIKTNPDVVNLPWPFEIQEFKQP